MSADNLLTILLILKDRVPFTLRWMRYANEMRFPFKILIADGGAEGRLAEILADRASFSNVNYEYIRYPYDRTYSHYYAKIVDALMRIDTPFVALADNDDFFISDGLAKSIETLQNHPEYVSCRGAIGGVSLTPNTRFGVLSQVYGKKDEIFFAAQIYPPGSTLGDTALQRIQYYFSAYRTAWYDVSRTEKKLEEFRALQSLDIKDIILASHLPELLGVVSGNIHRSPYLYLIRQMDSPDSSDRMEIREKGDHFDRMLLESWSGDFNGFVNAIAAAVSEKDKITIEKARQLVKQGYRSYMAPAIVDGLLATTHSLERLWIARKTISRFGQAYRYFRSLISGQPSLRQTVPGYRFITSHSEFKPVYDFLTSPPSSFEMI